MPARPTTVGSRSVHFVRSVIVAASLAAPSVPSVLPSARVGAATAHELDVLVVARRSNALGFESYAINPTTHHDLFTASTGTLADRLVLGHLGRVWGYPTHGLAPVPLDAPQDRRGATSPISGPEVGLARTVRDGLRHLLIVKAAFSGSSLAQDWQPSDDDYTALLRKVGSASAWARAHRFVPSFDALTGSRERPTR